MRATGSGATARLDGHERRVVAARPGARRQQQRLDAAIGRGSQPRLGAIRSAEEDPAGLGEVGDAVGGVVDLAAVVGVGLAQQRAEAALHVLGAGRRRRSPSTSSAHRRGSAKAVAAQRRSASPARWRIVAGADRAPPRQAPPDHVEHAGPAPAWASWPAA